MTECQKFPFSSSILASSPLSHIKVHTLAQYMLVYFQNFNLLGCIIADVRVHFCLVSVWHSFCQSTPYLGSRLQHFLWGVLRYSNFLSIFLLWKGLEKIEKNAAISLMIMIAIAVLVPLVLSLVFPLLLLMWLSFFYFSFSSMVHSWRMLLCHYELITRYWIPSKGHIDGNILHQI